MLDKTTLKVLGLKLDEALNSRDQAARVDTLCGFSPGEKEAVCDAAQELNDDRRKAAIEQTKRPGRKAPDLKAFDKRDAELAELRKAFRARAGLVSVGS